MFNGYIDNLLLFSSVQIASSSSTSSDPVPDQIRTHQSRVLYQHIFHGERVRVRVAFSGVQEYDLVVATIPVPR